MKYTQKSFSTPGNSKEYRMNFDKAFGKLKCEITGEKLTEESQAENNGVFCSCASCNYWFDRFEREK